MTQDDDGLTEQQQQFVDEYFKTGNASAAARSAGFAARAAASLLETPAIQAKIERRRAETATEAPNEGDVQALIREADAAIRIAEASNNASGMVAALTLKSRLVGALRGNELAEGAESETSAKPLSNRELAMTVLSIFREVFGDSRIVMVAPGETILRVCSDKVPDVQKFLGGEVEPLQPFDERGGA